MEGLPIPSSLIGTVVFFGLIAMVMQLVIRETLRVILKPALVVVVLALLAVWAGLLDGTVVEQSLTWLGDRLLLAASMTSDWVAATFESRQGTPPAN